MDTHLSFENITKLVGFYLKVAIIAAVGSVVIFEAVAALPNVSWGAAWELGWPILVLPAWAVGVLWASRNVEKANSVVAQRVVLGLVLVGFALGIISIIVTGFEPPPDKLAVHRVLRRLFELMLYATAGLFFVSRLRRGHHEVDRERQDNRE